MGGTGAAYGAIMCYAIHGTKMVYGARHLLWLLSANKVRYGPTRICYAMSGTEIGSFGLRSASGYSGTDTGYCCTRKQRASR
eukprot:1946774-Rhodomonas_salina.2